MFGNSGKLGRGGGGRGAKRLMPPPPAHRPAGGASRLSIGAAPASRNRNAGQPPAAALPVPEESFSLVSADALAFGLIIRLAPDLVEEIKRVEAQGGVPRIKFAANPNNSAGNVIDVGGKDFRFTWSRELGDCDIYEERQSGEDGNGLLIESGSVWRKLNVQRVLDESTKNHVKKRSEEAERQLKSRKAIVLDPANPSVKNQVKTLAAAAVDMNARRTPYKKTKDPPFKRRKVEPNQGPPKSLLKPGASSSTVKNQPSISPQPSPPAQCTSSVSPFRRGNSSRGQTNIDEIIATPQPTTKEEPNSIEKDPSKSIGTAGRELYGLKGRVGATPMDLQGTLINLLLENPKGMNLKALEKAVSDTYPNSGRKIEAIIKKIATYQAPGRYILKPGVEMESVRKPSSESGSSPESIQHQIPGAESTFPEKGITEEFEPKTDLSSSLQAEANYNAEKLDIGPNSSDTSDRKVGDNSEEKAGSSSESGSDSESDSDSSDSGSASGSQSRSRSKSRSPAGSESGSSSDSESDGSSSSKEGSDVEVDILSSEDKKGEHVSEPRVDSGTSDDGHERVGVEESKEDSLVSPLIGSMDLKKSEHMDDADDIDLDIDVTGDSPIAVTEHKHQENDIGESTGLVPQGSKIGSLEDEVQYGSEFYKRSGKKKGAYVGGSGIDKGDMTSKREVAKAASAHQLAERTDRVSKPKSKRVSDRSHIQEHAEDVKRLRVGSLGSELSKEEAFDNAFDSQRGHGQAFPHKSMSNENINKGQLGSSIHNLSVPDLHQSSQRVGEVSLRGKASDVVERPGKYAETVGRGGKNFESASSFHDELDVPAMKSTTFSDKLPMAKEKLYKEARIEDSDEWAKSFTKNIKGSAIGEKQSDSSYRKTSEVNAKLKDGGQVEKSSMLRRELSDLELGEFREPVPSDEVQVSKKKFERKSSFRSFENEFRESAPVEDVQTTKSFLVEKKNSFRTPENRSSGSDNLSSDFGKGRSVAKTVQELKRSSSPYHRVGVNQEDISKKRSSEDDFDDSMGHQAMDLVDSDGGSHKDRTTKITHKARKSEARASKLSNLEGHGARSKKTLGNTPNYGGPAMGGSTSQEAKLHKVKAVTELSDKRRDKISLESYSNGDKKRDLSSDDETSLYSQYDKNEPEFKGPIKDYQEYKEYVQEYREKFTLYRSLGQSMEKYSHEFNKFGQDLEHARGRDVERYFRILEQMKESYRRDGKRHQKLKKIFIVIHDELKDIKQRIVDYAEARSRD
ncbi:hypothetical protein H6P81_015026 [Aristolochia fimbriata]|uniref:OCEL domain-containing protein n=1 Tax=Aristolochia fimbriata TaxID=158543 RepID=A0AAV7E781_ARIFI|nr:hypothetical protein H6P81_015026 [Aristolochia fimbriata]